MSRKSDDGEIITDKEEMKTLAYDVLSEAIRCDNTTENKVQLVTIVNVLDDFIDRLCGSAERYVDPYGDD